MSGCYSRLWKSQFPSRDKEKIFAIFVVMMIRESVPGNPGSTCETSSPLLGHSVLNKLVPQALPVSTVLKEQHPHQNRLESPFRKSACISALCTLMAPKRAPSRGADREPLSSLVWPEAAPSEPLLLSLGTCEKCRPLGPTPDVLNQNICRW